MFLNENARNSLNENENASKRYFFSSDTSLSFPSSWAPQTRPASCLQVFRTSENGRQKKWKLRESLFILRLWLGSVPDSVERSSRGPETSCSSSARSRKHISNQAPSSSPCLRHPITERCPRISWKVKS